MEGTKPRTGEGIAGGRGSGPGPLRSLLWKAPARLPDERYSLSSPCPQTLLVTQEQRARFTPVTKSSGASQHQITTRKRPEAFGLRGLETTHLQALPLSPKSLPLRLNMLIANQNKHLY